jgi:hypothetical protein
MISLQANTVLHPTSLPATSMVLATISSTLPELK